MAKQAIITGGEIVEFPDFVVHPDILTEVPDEAEIGWRVSGSGVVAPDARATWHIDADGGMHAEGNGDRQKLKCAFADRLVRDDGTWRVKTTGEELTAVKAKAKATIDAAAETERLKYITPGAGQALTYQHKVAEALSVTAKKNPSPKDYPLLAASIGIDGETIDEIARSVLAMNEQWTRIAADIETVRLSTKRAIADAPDEATAEAIMADVAWPLV